MMLAALLLIPTVAVMPFKDLSGGRGQVGEAIRETVTSDLKGVDGLKVVERGDIDKIIAEQNLQGKKNDLGMGESIRVGTLLGATLIVAGSYQKAATQVRLIARFVDVARSSALREERVSLRANTAGTKRGDKSPSAATSDCTFLAFMVPLRFVTAGAT